MISPFQHGENGAKGGLTPGWVEIKVPSAQGAKVITTCCSANVSSNAVALPGGVTCPQLLYHRRAKGIT